jgi:hypothetical protein
MKDLYTHIIEKTAGSLDVHFIQKVLLELVRSKTPLYFFANKPLAASDAEEGLEEVADGKVLTNGKVSFFGDNQKLLVKPENLSLASTSQACFSILTDLDGNTYYITDETQMFLESLCISLNSIFIDVPTKRKVREVRLEKVREYFDRYRTEHGMDNLSNNQIYTKIGSPTREALWRDFKRLWPSTFRSFQEGDFRYSPLREIPFLYGTGAGRRKINPLLSVK